jgi:hypothetical protein
MPTYLETACDPADMEDLGVLPDFKLLWGLPGPRDEEGMKKYLRPYLSKRESKILYLKLECGLSYDEISDYMKGNPVSLRQFYHRTKKKVFKEEKK